MEDFLYRVRPWAITLVLHNWPIIIVSAAVPLAALLAYLRPTRRRLLVLYGLIVLAFAFEYQKHGVGVVESTTDYLFSEYANPAARHVSQLVLARALPWMLDGLGLALLLVAALWGAPWGPPWGPPWGRSRRSVQHAAAPGTQEPSGGERVARSSEPVPPV